MVDPGYMNSSILSVGAVSIFLLWLRFA